MKISLSQDLQTGRSSYTLALKFNTAAMLFAGIAVAPNFSSSKGPQKAIYVLYFSNSPRNMAKSKRKRKLKEQDFQRVKFKVGKKLKPADNATDSSFKSRAIFIPTQLHTLDNVPTNQRNQTLKVQEFRL